MVAMVSFSPTCVTQHHLSAIFSTCSSQKYTSGARRALKLTMETMETMRRPGCGSSVGRPPPCAPSPAILSTSDKVRCSTEAYRT
jgi:hypothetical protein